jgi:hypothetical protein
MISHAIAVLNKVGLNSRWVMMSAISAGLLIASAATVQAQNAPAPWITRFTGKHVVGEGVGHTDGFTSLEWFLPLDRNSRSTMWFADFAGLLFERNSYGANLGIGYRNYVPEQNRIYGLNAYWDVRQDDGLLFNQAALGFESLGEVFDVRVNGYTPTVNDASQPLPSEFVGHNLLYREMNALSGVDYEGTVHLPDWRSIQTAVSAGGYYFDSSSTAAANGWRARASVAFRDMVAAQFVVQDDQVFGRTYNVIVELRNLIRHRATSNTPMDPLFRNLEGSGDGRTIMHRLGDPVVRQQNIVLQRREFVARDTGGTPFTFLHVVEGAVGGDGSIDNPYGSFTNAMADGMAGTAITYTPRGGTFTEDFMLADGATVWSNGPLRQISTTDGLATLPFSGANAELGSSPSTINGNVTLNNNTEFSGFNVMGGLNGAGLTSVNVNRMAINMSPMDAIGLTGSDGVSLTDLLITSPAVHGISLGDTTATLTRVEIQDAGDDAIEIATAGTNPTVTIDTLTVANALGEAIDVDAGAGDLALTVQNFTTNSNDHGLSVTKTGAGDVTLSLQNGNVTSDTGTGIRVDGSGGGGGTLYVTRFETMTVQAANTGGILFDTVTFDANGAAAGIPTVASQTLNVGASGARVNGSGVSLTNVMGSWNMGTASIFNRSGAGVHVDNSAGTITDLTLSSLADGTLDTLDHLSLDLDTVTTDLNFNSVISTDSIDHAIELNTVTGEIVSRSTTSTNSTAKAFYYENIMAADPFVANFGATTINEALGPAQADNVDTIGDTTGLTQIYTPLTINFP